MSLRDAIAARRILVVAGSGGVGKTTMAAAIGIAAALEGKRVLVLAIDPAKRLATALGIDALAGEPRAIDLDRLAPRDARAPGGRLLAAVLDRERTGDALVARVAPPAVAARVLANPFYRRLARTFSGTHEYAALERLCVEAANPTHDLIVVDTPPARHALDLVDAPRRLAAFFDRRVIRWLLPNGLAGAVGGLAGALVRRLRAATGIATLGQIADLSSALAGSVARIRARAIEAHRLLRAPATAFVLVSSAEGPAIAESIAFAERAASMRLLLAAAILNRAHESPPAIESPPEAIAPLIARALGGVPDATALARELAATFDDHRRLGAAEARRARSLRAALPPGIPVLTVPPYPALAGADALAAIRERLFASREEALTRSL